MDTYLSRHLPIITNRIEFSPQKLRSPPIITPRIDFAKRLANATAENSVSTDDFYDPNGDSSVMDINAAIVTSATPSADVNSDSGGEETADLLDKKIPKPKGQAGHPGSGGYSLEFVLRTWGSTLISDVNVSH